MLTLPAATRVALLAALAQAHAEQADAQARAVQAIRARRTLIESVAEAPVRQQAAVIEPSVSLQTSVYLKNETRVNHAHVLGIP